MGMVVTVASSKGANALAQPGSASAEPTAAQALRSFRALKDGGPLEVNVLTSSLAAILTLLRWGAIAIGLGWAATQASSGNVRVVGTLAVTIFVATFRTVIPLRTDTSSRSALLWACADVLVLGVGLGLSAGLSSPFVGCIMVAVAVVAFGWGLPFGVMASVLAFAASGLSKIYFTDGSIAFSPLAVLALVTAALFPGIYHISLADAELSL